MDASRGCRQVRIGQMVYDALIPELVWHRLEFCGSVRIVNRSQRQFSCFKGAGEFVSRWCSYVGGGRSPSRQPIETCLCVRGKVWVIVEVVEATKLVAAMAKQLIHHPGQSLQC